ncbi:ERCC4 domain-containing protein [Diplocarpon rosae]|nr:ERCC4 domain-containing protein [Diplocarpon rosae]
MASIIEISSSPQLPLTRSARPTAPSQVTKPANADFVELSSDGDQALLPAIPASLVPEKYTASTLHKAATLACEKPPNSTSVKPTDASSSRSSALDVASTSILGLVSGKFDFQFLSDDFDSTVNLESAAPFDDDDDPFASDLPPPKKRRISPSPTAQPAKREPKFTKAYSRVAESDPLMFTSSPDPYYEAAKRREQRRCQIKHRNIEHELFVSTVEKDAASSVSTRKKAAHLLTNIPDDGSDSDLPNVASVPYKIPLQISKPSSSQRALDKYNAEKTMGTGKASKAKVDKLQEKTEQARERAEKTKEKAAAKESVKEQKRLEKERKAREKQLAIELAKVNQVKTDKKNSTPEMIVDFPSSLNPILLAQASAMLTPLGAECSTWESDLPSVKWRRKVVAEYDEEADHWVPVVKYVKAEKHIMCIMMAQSIVDLITGAEGGDLDAHVLKLKSKFDSCTLIYLIEGHSAWMKKNKNRLNRKYEAAVNSYIPSQGTETSSQKSRRRKKEPEYVAEDKIEDALLRLQIVHGVFIHHTSAMVETAEWIMNFTQHISSIPYRTQKESLDSAFCMDSGQVKSGEDAADTFVRMLQELSQVTPSVAYGIAAKYPTVQELVEGLQKFGPLALEDCKKTTSKNGAFSDKRVGPSISKRIHKVFLGKDPGSNEV